MDKRSHDKDLSEHEIRKMLFPKAISIKMCLNIILNYIFLEEKKKHIW